MNKTQLICLAVFSVFAVIGFGPVSPTCLIGFVIVLFRPVWFKRLTASLYSGKSYTNKKLAFSEAESKQARKNFFYSLLTLFTIDILPIPVTAPIAMLIVVIRPEWFYRMVVKMYSPHHMETNPSSG